GSRPIDHKPAFAAASAKCRASAPGHGCASTTLRIFRTATRAAGAVTIGANRSWSAFVSAKPLELLQQSAMTRFRVAPVPAVFPAAASLTWTNPIAGSTPTARAGAVGWGHAYRDPL